MRLAAPITDLYARPTPDRAVVLGKGPSLDLYKASNGESAYIVGLNNVALFVPCSAALFADSGYKNYEFPEGIDIIRTTRFRAEHGGRGFVISVINPERFVPGARKTNVPLYGYGSLTIAIAVLGEWGVRHIDFWGCDSLVDGGDCTSYAGTIAKSCRVAPDVKKYPELAERARYALAHYGIEWEAHVQ